MRKDLLTVIEKDPHLHRRAQSTFIGIFDHNTELPTLYAAGLSTVTGVTWFYDHDIPKETSVSYILMDNKEIREKTFPGYKETQFEDFTGHTMFGWWWKRRKVIEAARLFQLRVPTFKYMENVTHFHMILNVTNLPIYRMITAGIALNYFLYRGKGYDIAACTEAFFERYPTLQSHRNRVTANLEGGWLDARLPKGSSETVEFNINQLTGA